MNYLSFSSGTLEKQSLYTLQYKKEGMFTWVAKKLPLGIVEAFNRFMLKDYSRTLKFITSADPDMLQSIGAKKAIKIFKHAEKNVPAYHSFCLKNKVYSTEIKTEADFNSLVPITEKKNYIKRYSLQDRCQNGRFPQHGNIDESGGTSGKPSNWIRSVQENELILQIAKFEFEYVYNISNKNIIVLSAWSTGPWATGIKFCQLMQNYALVKSTGTSIQNIEETLQTFGAEQEYILAGYPPFLKKFLDETKLNLKSYKIHLLTGGEGISLEWKEYFKKKLSKDAIIISSYGASDIDIGIGFETPFAQLIREACQKNEALKQKLFGHVPTIPMLFQYNPLLHYITQTYNKEEAKNEFVITLCDKNVASPKVRYNLHDEGGVFTFKEMQQILQTHAPDFVEKYKEMYVRWPILKLPFLYVAGRTDGTISVDGANVYPAQVEAGILSVKELEKKTNSFLLYKATMKKQDLKLTIAIELKEKVATGKALQKKFHDAILKKLLELNPDFRESYKYNKALCDPQIILHKHNAKLFADNEERVKEKYIV